MELEQVAELLVSAGLIGEIMHDRVSDFRFIALSRRAADASGNVTVPARLPCIVYLEGTQCIVSIELAGIITISHDASVIVQSILDWWDTYGQLKDYPLYRAIQAIKETGYAALFEDRKIYIYELGDEKGVLDLYEIEGRIEEFGNFDKENSCAVFEFQDKLWTYRSSFANTDRTEMTLEQCVELFKDEINKNG